VPFDLAPEDRAFRDELRSFLASHPPAARDDSFETGLAWQRVLHEGGWVAPHWPVDVGGRGATSTRYGIYWIEMGAAGAPQIANRVGVNTAGPTLLAHGTPEQRAALLPKILSGEEIWCQLFSEPDAGSDLGAIRTTAVLDGDTWIVNGHKVWTSFGRQAHRGLLLVRTEGPESPGVRGLSCMVVDMRVPGVEVRPLVQLTGDDEFSEVFLDDVRVPAGALIGERGKGWPVASSALGSERGIAYPLKEQVVLQVRHDANMAVALAAARVGELVPATRAAVVDDVIGLQIYKLLNQRTLGLLEVGIEPGAWTSLIKLSWSLLAQRVSSTTLKLAGMAGVAGVARSADAGAPGVPGGDAPPPWFDFLRYRMSTIAGGTSEIQKNLLAERILGLPRS
jgi:alkylation response protein AidB-like acyl-CoA dehydrogenase